MKKLDYYNGKNNGAFPKVVKYEQGNYIYWESKNNPIKIPVTLGEYLRDTIIITTEENNNNNNDNSIIPSKFKVIYCSCGAYQKTHHKWIDEGSPKYCQECGKKYKKRFLKIKSINIIDEMGHTQDIPLSLLFMYNNNNTQKG